MRNHVFIILPELSTDAGEVEAAARRLEALVLKVVSHESKIRLRIHGQYQSTVLIGDALTDRLKAGVTSSSRSVLADRAKLITQEGTIDWTDFAKDLDCDLMIWIDDEPRQVEIFASSYSMVDLSVSDVRSIAEIGQPRPLRAGDVFFCETRNARWVCLAEV